MYREHHYHSTCQEVLVIVSERGAKLCFGGSEKSKGAVIVNVRQGDVIVVPAGVGHALLEEEDKPGVTGGFQMVGSYPVEADHWDMRTAKDDQSTTDEARERIRGLEWFRKDPIYGDSGSAMTR